MVPLQVDTDRSISTALYNYFLAIYNKLYIICLISLINSFKVAFIYYLKYTISIKEVDGSKYNCSY